MDDQAGWEEGRIRHLTPALSPFEAEREKPFVFLRGDFIRVHPP
jgi:hypothetical protein